MYNETSYVDNEMMLQRSTSNPKALRSLTEWFRGKIHHAKFININFAPGKAYLMPLIPISSKTKLNETLSITVGDRLVLPTQTISSLTVVIDKGLLF